MAQRSDTRLEARLMYLARLVQGVTLVTFPAASSILNQSASAWQRVEQ
jgi:hypothetical protein